ncbi:MAG: tetratricopeptide repeat-containing protein [Litorimonas sp.]
MPINEIDIYNRAIEQLKATPDSLTFQHQAVLSLARAGSLDFAVQEYNRYGLDKINDAPNDKLLEDVICLGGRLLKDLHHSYSGQVAIDFARKSSEKYEQAFKATGGYYSAINAATMAFAANMPLEMVHHRAQDILRDLPKAEDTNSETRYFIEATRAEAELLLGNPYRAQRYLKAAVMHDPQNYAAHATTLNQLEMILRKRGESCNWLAAFRPPKPAHFAGHLFKIGNQANAGEFDASAYAQLKIDMSDEIQRQNIGFGYGALAAGADITIAEALLEEGAALHVVLPVNPDVFIEHSVKPFGQNWVKRFKYCWKAADSRHVASTQTIWPNAQIDDYASRIAMGKTIQMAQRFSIESQQLLLWDKRPAAQGTGRSALDWSSTGRTQFVWPYFGKRRLIAGDVTLPADVSIKVSLHQNNHDKVMSFFDLDEAINYALDQQSQHKNQLQIGLHVDVNVNQDMSFETAKKLSNKALPGSIFVSETAACLLLFEHEDKYTLSYLGQCGAPTSAIPIYGLKLTA